MATEERLQVRIGGLVQGVGFRPFVYQLARACGIHGWVANDSGGVQLEVQGGSAQLREFLRRLVAEKPSHARITSLEAEPLPPGPADGFTIRPSQAGAGPTAILLPDLAPCGECLQEMSDPASRRYRYPFTNCTQCGPRFSIVTGLPYDRANTVMNRFPFCADCQREYTDPHDRRFHAEPIACPACGPQLMLCDNRRQPLAQGAQALERALRELAAGRLLALKGVGGFQLLADAASEAAVAELRRRKQRPDKPFAMLYPDPATVERDCHVSPCERSLLCGPERPIVLLARRSSCAHIPDSVAPGSPDLGIMLPCSPLHHLLMAGLQRPLVCTSGNLSGEPICRDDAGAFARLGGVADLFLTHDRPIAHAVDDSVVREADGAPLLLRRARGYVPVPIELPPDGSGAELVAVGADLKNCPAVARGARAYLAQHIGDLDNPRAQDNFVDVIGGLAATYPAAADELVCDLHPGYISARWARRQGFPVHTVQHHVGHFFACMAEHGYRGPALGICWDGTGYGEDGGLRGSEFLYWDGGGEVRHVARLREFPLPGGERAIREPRRQAAGLLHALPAAQATLREFLRQNFSPVVARNLDRMLERQLQAPCASSAGRLFDAVSALLGLVTTSTFEGQAAMAVEHAAAGSANGRCYPFDLLRAGAGWQLDWGPMVEALLSDGRHGASVADRAAAFHNTLARMILAVAEQVASKQVFLSGGVFQNRRLLETASALLRGRGFRVHSHRRVPPNDGGIALGQIYYTRCMRHSDRKAGEGSALCV